MPNQHKTRLLGWHPASAEDAGRVRGEAERRGVRLKVVLDEMLRKYVEWLDRPAAPPAPVATRPEQPQQARRHALTCKCGTCRPK